MDLSRKGIGNGAKTAAVIALVFIVLAGVYFAPSFSMSGTPSSTSFQTGGPSPNSGPGSQFPGLVALFAQFSQLDMQVSVVNTNPENAINQQATLSYLVLGKATMNSIQYTKVEFSTPGTGNTVVAWFDSKGGIDRVDVLGQRNYTGNGALFFASTYLNTLIAIPTITNNATLLSMLSKTAENTTSIGPTQVNLTTYSLAVPTPPYKSITVRYATIPGTSDKLAVYLHSKTTDGTDTTIQVTSLTKSQ